MRIQPLADCLVLRRTGKKPFSDGGIYLGDREEDDITLKPIIYGEIIAVGPGKKTDDGRSTMWDLKAGDRIAFSPNGNHHFNIDGEDVIMIRRNSVVGLVE